jgi:hypothetical protein
MVFYLPSQEKRAQRPDLRYGNQVDAAIAKRTGASQLDVKAHSVEPVGNQVLELAWRKLLQFIWTVPQNV